MKRTCRHSEVTLRVRYPSFGDAVNLDLLGWPFPTLDEKPGDQLKRVRNMRLATLRMLRSR